MSASKAFAELIKRVNVKYYIGANQAKLIEDACNPPKIEKKETVVKPVDRGGKPLKKKTED